jgi:hypothetical protein
MKKSTPYLFLKTISSISYTAPFFVLVFIINLFFAFTPSIISAQSEAIKLQLGQEAIDQNLPGTAGIEAGEEGAYTASFALLIGSLMSLAMAIGALIVFLQLIWGGIEWITAGGDSGKLQKARDRIMQAIIGLIVLGSVVALFTLLQNFLGICILDFGQCTAGADAPTPTSPPNPTRPPRVSAPPLPYE